MPSRQCAAETTAAQREPGRAASAESAFRTAITAESSVPRGETGFDSLSVLSLRRVSLKLRQARAWNGTMAALFAQ